MNNLTPLLKYELGNERKEIIENDNFNNSIFSSQYSQTLSIIENTIEEKIDNALNIIAICGERGVGKTSCMKTVLNLLKNSNNIYLDKFKNIQNSTFHILEIIDPAFFDKSHNILELVLGQMYISVKDHYIKNHDVLMKSCINELMMDFDKVKDCIYELKRHSKGEFDNDAELEVLAYSTELKKNISSLVQKFLELFKAKKLIIPIDDIDLNINEAYSMCEQIRKYLSHNDCIVIFAVKIEQLYQAICGGIFEEKIKAYKGSGLDMMKEKNEVLSMSKKYLDKFIPSSARIYLPEVYQISESRLEISNKNGKKFRSKCLKEGIIELIFQKTRYLFYNKEGGISPIIPNNLRELNLLLGLLMHMNNTDGYAENKTDVTQKSYLRDNQARFKNFLFTEWIKCLPEDKINMIINLVNQENINLTNKLVCKILTENFSSISEQDFSIEDNDGSTHHTESNPIKILQNSANFSYNISIGDVFKLINMIESDFLTEEEEKLLFIIKSLYSIRLYEAYDLITEITGNVYPEDVKSKSNGVYRYDERFNHTNQLQRIVGGNYLSFYPGELLPSELQTRQTLDTCIINVKSDIDKDWNVENIFIKAQNIIKKYKAGAIHEISNEETWTVNTAEYIILTCNRTIDARKTQKFSYLESSYRSNVEPVYFRAFNKERGYYVFDCLAPFAALTNPEYTYERFELLSDISFNDFLCFPSSLINNMIKAVYANQNYHHLKIEESYIDNKYTDYFNNLKRKFLWTLQSDAIIRNAEVLAAIFQNIKSLRYEDKKSKGLKKIRNLYKKISESNMKTHKLSEKDENTYTIHFAFLKPLMEYLDNTENNLNYKKRLENIIFSYNPIKRYESIEDFITNGLKIIKNLNYNPSTIKDRILKIKNISNDLRMQMANAFDTVNEKINRPMIISILKHFEKDIKTIIK